LLAAILRYFMGVEETMKTFASLNKNIEELTKTIPHLDQLPDDDPNRCPLCDG